MPFGNPFSNIRFGNIMGGNVDRESMTDFNPALRTPESIAPNPMGISKRFFGNVVPQQEPPAKPIAPAQSISTGYQGTGDESAQRYFDLLQSISNNRPRQTEYAEAVANPPDASLYQPSKWRRLASSLAGAATGFGEGAGAGIAAGEHILTSPYRAALQDYDIRTKGLESAANVEAAQVSDYLKNLEMATKYGFDRDKLGMEQFFKGIESEQAGRKLEIEAAKAEADRQQALGQIKRWLAQTRNEDEKNDLDRLRIGIEQGNQASLAEYRRITGQAAQTTAGAAVTRAEAAKQTADKYQPYSAARTPTVQEQGRARNLVLEEMMTEPRYKKFIEVNTDAYGPSFVITEEGSLNEGLRAEINRRVNEKLRQSYTGFGGNTPIADEADEPDPDDYGDFELGPLSVGPGR